MNGLHPVDLVIISVLTEANDYVDTRKLCEIIGIDAIHLAKFVRALEARNKIEYHPDTDFKVRLVQTESVATHE